MSTLPTEFRDRWKNRPEPAPGFGTVYWHVLMSRYEGARLAAQNTQEVLSQFDGFHLTPPEWLHMTTFLVGPAERYSRSQLVDMTAIATDLLGSTSKIETSISRILYHPEAIMLAIDPAEAIKPIRDAAQIASESHHSSSRERLRPWVPHMTIGYSVTSQIAEPIIAKLGRSIPPHRATIDRLNLVVQWGPERSWEWEPVGEIILPRLTT